MEYGYHWGRPSRLSFPQGEEWYLGGQEGVNRFVRELEVTAGVIVEELRNKRKKMSVEVLDFRDLDIDDEFPITPYMLINSCEQEIRPS